MKTAENKWIKVIACLLGILTCFVIIGLGIGSNLPYPYNFYMEMVGPAAGLFFGVWLVLIIAKSWRALYANKDARFRK